MRYTDIGHSVRPVLWLAVGGLMMVYALLRMWAAYEMRGIGNPNDGSVAEEKAARLGVTRSQSAALAGLLIGVLGASMVAIGLNAWAATYILSAAWAGGILLLLARRARVSRRG